MDGRIVEKAGAAVVPESRVTVTGSESAFVSRGGDKLAGALAAFPVALRGAIIIDVGASTGGFTDAVLQGGAARVYAVDVGYGQLAWKLQQDPRVIRLDRVNIRKAGRDLIPEECDLALIDTSFISLKIVLPPTLAFLKEGGEVLALVKPQFEVGKGRVGKGGIVRDPALQREVLLELVQFCHDNGLDPRGWIESPLRGRDGNLEFFLYCVWGGSGERTEAIKREIRSWPPPS